MITVPATTDPSPPRSDNRSTALPPRLKMTARRNIFSNRRAGPCCHRRNILDEPTVASTGNELTTTNASGTADFRYALRSPTSVSTPRDQPVHTSREVDPGQFGCAAFNHDDRKDKQGCDDHRDLQVPAYPFGPRIQADCQTTSTGY